ncbi:putative homocysteine S methyltransferase [Trypanosoma vivax]|nr:putative homocysteine S methyltransferase [Trypanosoma vivax]
MWATSALATHPKQVQSIHESYIRAGADIILTCTYQIFAEGCIKEGTTIRELTDLAVQVARDAIESTGKTAVCGRSHTKLDGNESGTAHGAAVDVFKPLISAMKNDKLERPVLIGASLGPFGSVMALGCEYTGNYIVGMDLIREFHVERLRAFIEYSSDRAHLKTDFFAMETFPRLDEALCIFSWLQNEAEEVLRNAPLSLSFVASPINEPPSVDVDDATLESWWQMAESKVSIPDGHTFEQALAALLRLEAPQHIGFGCNCSGPLEVSLVASVMLKKKKKGNTDRSMALLLYSNSGEAFINGNWHWCEQPAPHDTLPAEQKGPMSLSQLRRMLLRRNASVRTCAMFVTALCRLRPKADDWLFDIVVVGGCCRSTPDDIVVIRSLT